MKSELFLGGPWLWTYLWQSTIFVALGLAGSFILRHRPSRAHQVLLLSMVAAVTVPTASILVKHFELGVFVAGPVVMESRADDWNPASHHEPSAIVPPESIEHQAAPIRESTAPVTESSRRIEFPWRSVVLYGWVAASLILAGRLLVTFRFGLRLLGRAVPLDCERIERAVYRAKTRLGINKDVKVCSSRHMRSPVIWCWGRSPVLLVPSAAGQCDVDWTGVLCHELAHYKRRDHISGLLAELAVCILPWQPFLWWAEFGLTGLSEQACDDWVIATGQPGADYAESLLDLTPGGQMAFVPAVVSTKRGLAGRIRRILEEKCASPRSGLRWSIATAAIAGCIAVGVAFARTRSPEPSKTIKTSVGHSVVIEQLSSATVIKGRILDSNNEPLRSACVIAFPATSYAALSRYDRDGQFELPWLPTWLDEGQPIYLMAKSDKHEAAFVEVTDPTQPVTIRLEPAPALEGKVVDPNGQRIRYSATLSLLKDFKCQAPIYKTTVGYPRVRIFSPIPYGPRYKLTIKADGYQTKLITVDAADRNQAIIDIGTITLQLAAPVQSALTQKKPDSNLVKEFHKIHRLDEGEILKLIKPPFVLGRQEYFNYTFLGMHDWRGPVAYFYWKDELEIRLSTGGSHLNMIFYLLSDIPAHDFELPRGLNIRLPQGDWIVRRGLPITEQLAALEAFLQAELNRSIRFEKRTIEREVIVARGRYKFKPHPSGDHPDYIPVTSDDRLITKERTAGSLGEFLRFIETQTEIKIVDKTEPIENTIIRYKMGPGVFMLGTRSRRSELLSALLDNLAKTTSLQFTVEHQPAEVWCVTEQTDN